MVDTNRSIFEAISQELGDVRWSMRTENKSVRGAVLYARRTSAPETPQQPPHTHTRVCRATSFFPHRLATCHVSTVASAVQYLPAPPQWVPPPSSSPPVSAQLVRGIASSWLPPALRRLLQCELPNQEIARKPLCSAIASSVSKVLTEPFPDNF